jgi:adenylate kinase family enzyme
MRIAIHLFGPSGVGKSTLAKKICEYYNYKYCDADTFKVIYSKERSKIRTQIGEKIAYVYGLELIKHKENIVIEAISNKYLAPLKKELKKAKYIQIEISLEASLKQCIKNNKTRKIKGYKTKVIKDAYKKLCFNNGTVINVENKTKNQVFNIAKKIINNNL